MDFKTIKESLKAIEDKKISVLELSQIFIERIKKLKNINAFIYFDEELIKKKCIKIQDRKDLSLKGKDLFFPIRTALFGEPKGPDLPVILDILGKEKSINRIQKAILK